MDEKSLKSLKYFMDLSTPILLLIVFIITSALFYYFIYQPIFLYPVNPINFFVDRLMNINSQNNHLIIQFSDTTHPPITLLLMKNYGGKFTYRLGQLTFLYCSYVLIPCSQDVVTITLKNGCNTYVVLMNGYSVI